MPPMPRVALFIPCYIDQCYPDVGLATLEVLERYGLRPELIDIDSDPQLRERYTTCVPVVIIDGKERFRGRVNEVLLRRLL